MRIKILLINLDRSPERLASSKAWLDGLQLPFERLAAVDGKQLSDEEFASFAAERPALARLGMTWRRGEAGCLLSHFKAWELIAKSEADYTAVFEDDVHVSPAMKQVLADDAWVPRDIDIVRLELTSERVRMPKPALATVAGRQVFRMFGTTAYTGGYIISRKAAIALLAEPKDTHLVADFFLFDQRRSKVARRLKLGQIVPAVCVQDWELEKAAGHKGFESTVQPDEDRHTRLGYMWWLMRGRFRHLLGHRMVRYAA